METSGDVLGCGDPRGNKRPSVGLAEASISKLAVIAEVAVTLGRSLNAGGRLHTREYWAHRYWDRAAAEAHPILGEHYVSQRERVGQLIAQHSVESVRALDVACGQGFYSRLLLAESSSQLIAFDVSEAALRQAAKWVAGPRATLLQVDFWDLDFVSRFDIIVSIDALHHLGDISHVFDRLAPWLSDDGVFIGNLWTQDYFHEFERIRYGPAAHAAHSLQFLAESVFPLPFSRRGGAVRTILRTRRELELALNDRFQSIYTLEHMRYFSAFACGRPRLPVDA